MRDLQKMTVTDWLKNPRITPVVLTQFIDSSASNALRHAAYELFRADPDDEASYMRAADAYEQAEATFRDVHGNTEVEM
jgi:hypothetical protein